MPDIEEAAPENSLIDLSDNEIEIEYVQIRDFPKDGVFVGVFYRNQNKHTTLSAENGENSISA